MPKVGRPMGGVSEHCFGASPYFLNSLPNLTDFFIAYRTEEPETAAATRPFQAICISHSDGQAPPCGRYEIPFSGFRACYHGRRTLVRRPWYTRVAAAVPHPLRRKDRSHHTRKRCLSGRKTEKTYHHHEGSTSESPNFSDKIQNEQVRTIIPAPDKRRYYIRELST